MSGTAAIKKATDQTTVITQLEDLMESFSPPNGDKMFFRRSQVIVSRVKTDASVDNVAVKPSNCAQINESIIIDTMYTQKNNRP